MLQKIISDQCGFLREFCGQDPYAKSLGAVCVMCCALSTLPPLPPHTAYFRSLQVRHYCLETMSEEKEATFRAIDDDLKKEYSDGEPVKTFFFVITQVKAIRK